MTESTRDLIVLGAGPVGENVADSAHRAGLTTVVVEQELVGGECSYWACMPSKGLLRPGAALRAARHVGGAAEAVTGALDAAAVFARRTRITGGLDDRGQVQWLRSAGIDLVRGHGRITGVRRVAVDQADGTVVHLTARHAVVVATGSAALLPPIPGLAAAAPWTSREATTATHAPAHLVVLGGGVVAAELATAYRSLGSEVTLLARSGVLRTLEPFAGEAVTRALVAAGVTVRIGDSPVHVERTRAGVTLRFERGEVLTADELLVATGRIPRTHDLGLASVGLTDGDWLAVDDTLLVRAATNADSPWLYAAGDVNHRALLTHQGKYQARAVGRGIAARATAGVLDTAPWGEHVATADAHAVPQVVFTDPEVAAVGLTERDARAAGIAIRTVEYDLAGVAGAAVYDDAYEGRAKLVIDDERDVVLGATFVGPEIGELLHSATIAIVGEVPLRRLWHAVPSYPTVSEVWLRFLEQDAQQQADDHAHVGAAAGGEQDGAA